MGIKTCIFMLLAIAFLMSNAMTSARNLPLSVDRPRILDLETRLQASSNTDANTTDCWTALSKLRTCSNEVVGFFLNGYTDIDAPCCEAIQVIVHHCMSSMISALGFTAEQGNLLAAYCNKISTPPLDTKSTADSRV